MKPVATTRRKIVGTQIPAKYARRNGCLFMVPPCLSSQLIQQRGNQRQKENRRRDRHDQQSPVKPRHTNRGSLLQPSQHVRPKIAAQIRPILALAQWWNCAAQGFAKVFEFVLARSLFAQILSQVVIAHGRTPCFSSFVRNMRTPRNIRSLAATGVIPSDSAISWYDSSSIRPSWTTTRRRGGSSANAREIFLRVSSRTTASGFSSAAICSGSSNSGPAPPRWSSPSLTAMRLSHPPKFPS